MSTRLAGWFALLMVVVAGCSAHTRSDGTATSQVSFALTSTDFSFDLVYPNGYSVNKVAVGASQEVVLGPGVHIHAVNSGPGNVTNTGTTNLVAGPGATLGDLVNGGPIVVGPDVGATRVVAAGSVQRAPHDNVLSVTQNATITPLGRRTVTVAAPPDLPISRVVLQPGATSTIGPGRYGDVNISPGAQLTVRAGTYLVNNFVLGPTAKLNLDTSGGVVNFYVNSAIDWEGVETGDPTRFVLGLVGPGSFVIHGGFSGTALGPQATIDIGPSATPYVGTFYGRRVTIAPNVTINQLPTPFLIDQLNVAKTTLCVGESTEVTIPNLNPSVAASTWIQDVAGTHQFVQFANAPGARLVFASVQMPDGRTDFLSVPVTVQTCPSSTAPPPITFHFWGGRAKPNTVEFVVRGFDANGHEKAIAGPATYVWNFGDGQSLTTDSPLVTHDYTASIHPLDEHTFFTVTVAVTSGARTSSLTKVVPVWSLYAKNRAKGIIQPPTTVVSAGVDLTLNLTNLEPTPITITSGRVELVPCDPALSPVALPSQSLSVSIPAQSSQTIHLAGPATRGRDTCNLAIHVSGSGAAGTVYADGYKRLQENPVLRRLVTDPSTVALLNQAATMTSNPNQFSEQELRQLVAKGKLARMPRGLPPAATYADVGEECQPGDRDPTNGLVCLPTQDWVTNPPEILNGYKGDVFMDRGCGTIGQLLDSLHQHFSHDFLFVKNRVEIRHSTANEDRIADAVNIGGLRLDEHKLQFGFPGTEDLKTHSVGEMTSFYCVPDPDGNGGSDDERGCQGGTSCDCPVGTWRMGGESSPDPVTCSSDYTAVPSVVVRPPPSHPENYQTLGGVVDQALNISGHYRFFMYSHADTVLPAGTDSGWANGTPSTVCSSFVQLAALRAGVPMSPAKSGAQGVPDGLRSYLLDERLAAANTLFAITHNKVHDACSVVAPAGGAILGGVIGLIGGPAGAIIGAGVGGLTGVELCNHLAENIGNQNTNCFGNDQCANTDRLWEHPGTGVAVSPEDILGWELPSDGSTPGGTWGYNEAAVYAEVSFRHKYAWSKPAGTGSLTVHVVDPSSAPVPGATILVNDEVAGTSDSAGALHLDALAAGSYYVAAQLDPCSAVITNLPPLPTPPTADAIPSLPLCAAIDASDATTPACQRLFYEGDQCPKNWLEVDTVYPQGTVACVVDPSGATVTIPDSPYVGEPQLLCSCVRRAPSCPEVHPLQSGATPTTIVSDIDDSITIRLCNGGLQKQGNHSVPQSCPQSCTVDADCDVSLHCQDNLCIPRARRVHIVSTSLDIQTYDNDIFEGVVRRHFNPVIDEICDPDVDNGNAHYSQCVDDDETADFVLDSQCLLGSDGGFTVNLHAHLDEGCDTGDHTDHPDDHLNFTIGVAPASPGNPTPVTDYGAPDNQAASCFGAADCSENAAHFSLEFTNIPK